MEPGLRVREPFIHGDAAVRDELAETQGVQLRRNAPAAQRRRQFLREELRRGTGDHDPVALFFEEARHEAFPAQYGLDLVKEEVDLALLVRRVELVVRVKDEAEVPGGEASEPLVLEVDEEDALLRHALAEQLVDDLVKKVRLPHAPQPNDGVDLPRRRQGRGVAWEERERHPLLALHDDPLQGLLHHGLPPGIQVYTCFPFKRDTLTSRTPTPTSVQVGA